MDWLGMFSGNPDAGFPEPLRAGLLF